MSADSRLPTHDVLVASNLNKRNREENDFLRKVGSAWAHQDGKGFTLQLFALPTNGRLVLREPLQDDREAPPPVNQSNGYQRASKGR